MNNKAVIHCRKCGSVIFKGRQIYYDTGVELKDDGIAGEWLNGCGECEVCGRRLCEACGDFINGVCADCRAEEEATIHNMDVVAIEKKRVNFGPLPSGAYSGSLSPVAPEGFYRNLEEKAMENHYKLSEVAHA
jgi:hypothetical protein